MLLQAEREPNPLLDRQLVDPLPLEFRGTLDTATRAGTVMGSRLLCHASRIRRLKTTQQPPFSVAAGPAGYTRPLACEPYLLPG